MDICVHCGNQIEEKEPVEECQHCGCDLTEEQIKQADEVYKCGMFLCPDCAETYAEREHLTLATSNLYW